MIEWFYVAVGLVALVILYKGWRGGYLTEAAIFVGFMVTMVWITGPYATDAHRWILAGAVTAVGAVFIWRKWHSVWWPPLILIGTLLGLVVLYLSSSASNTLFFEGFMGSLFGYFFVSLLCWLFVRVILPRIQQKYQAPWVLILTVVFSAGMFFGALAWWLAAVEINVYPKNPVIRTGAELAAEYEKAKNLLGYRGLFLVGRIADSKRVPVAEAERGSGLSDYVAYYEARPFGISSDLAHLYLPLFYTVTLEDGTECSVAGIRTVRQAVNWQEGGPYVRMHCLRQGDPVVVWGDPGQTVGMADGKKSWGVNTTRSIAYGSLEEFTDGFLIPGVKTARLFGRLGFGCIPLCLIPLLIGIRRWRWLKREGGDEAPPANWRSPKDAMNDMAKAAKDSVRGKK
ncbi:MAG: hypothetical protein KDK97_02160 [Verrucomicrobiales bacterium]|nr:hypothetical protein [Verrucomicrobiales bacterium]